MNIPLPNRGVRAVCKRCHAVMDDCEPNGAAEFWHPAKFGDGKPNNCKNVNESYSQKDLDIGTEVEPFMRKRTRRAIKNRR